MPSRCWQELFTAGADTTTATVEWAMVELVRNPESMKRLGEELDREIGLGSATKENQLPGLPYLQAFTAGTDTTTATVEWAMVELVRNPESMKRLREELDREIGLGSTPKENQLPGLPYLQACVKETLRLHHPAPQLLPCRAPEPCTVMNYVKVLINVWAIGRDPKVWEDPSRFRPERFVNSSLDFKGNHFLFTPFGSGRRICPGLPMAAKHVTLLLATMVNLFKWRAPEGISFEEMDMSKKWGITMENAQPLLLIPNVRK